MQKLAEVTGVAADVLAAFEHGEVGRLCEPHADSLRGALGACVEFSAYGWLRHREDDALSGPDSGDTQEFLAQVQRERAQALPSDIQAMRQLRREQQKALREADKRAIIVVSLYLRDGVQRPDGSIAQELADNLLLRTTASVMRRLYDEYGTLVSASVLDGGMASVRDLRRQLAANVATGTSRAVQPPAHSTLPVAGAYVIEFPALNEPGERDDDMTEPGEPHPSDE